MTQFVSCARSILEVLCDGAKCAAARSKLSNTTGRRAGVACLSDDRLYMRRMHQIANGLLERPANSPEPVE